SSQSDPSPASIELEIAVAACASPKRRPYPRALRVHSFGRFALVIHALVKAALPSAPGDAISPATQVARSDEVRGEYAARSSRSSSGRWPAAASVGISTTVRSVAAPIRIPTRRVKANHMPRRTQLDLAADWEAFLRQPGAVKDEVQPNDGSALPISITSGRASFRPRVDRSTHGCASRVFPRVWRYESKRQSCAGRWAPVSGRTPTPRNSSSALWRCRAAGSGPPVVARRCSSLV